MQELESNPRKISWVGWLCAIGLVGAAFAYDTPTAIWVRRSGLEAWMTSHHHAWLRSFIKAFGNFMFSTLWIGLLLWWLHPLRLRAAALIWISAALSSVNWLIKWLAGRTRPYKLRINIPQPAPAHLEPLRGGIRGLFHQSDLDFPSGHACLAFAMAGALSILFPRGRWYFYLAASIVAIERVAENAHYLSDVVAGAVIGILCAKIAGRLLQPRVRPLL